MTEHINIGKGKVALVINVAESDDPLADLANWANAEYDRREQLQHQMHENWVRIRTFASVPGWVTWVTDGVLVLRVNVPRWQFTKPTHYWNEVKGSDKQPPLLRGL